MARVVLILAEILIVALSWASSSFALPNDSSSRGDNCLYFFGSDKVDPGTICIENLERLANDTNVPTTEKFTADIYQIDTLHERFTASVPLTLEVSHWYELGITTYYLRGTANDWTVYLSVQPFGEKEPSYAHNYGAFTGPSRERQVINRYVWEEEDPPEHPPGWNCRVHCK